MTAAARRARPFALLAALVAGALAPAPASARPDEGVAADPEWGYAVAEAPPFCLPVVCVHHVTSTADAPDLTDDEGQVGVPDAVERVAAAAEAARRCLVTTDEDACGLDATGTVGTTAGLGWPAPPGDGTKGTQTDRLDVYLQDVGATGRHGVTVPDPGQTGTSRTAWIVLDDDFDPAQLPEVQDPDRAMRVAAAHEMHHVVQHGMAATVDPWLFEATATAIEDLVLPTADDYVRYVDDWVTRDAQARPLATASGAVEPKSYGAAVLGHWLAGRHGPSVLREAWQAAATPSGGRPPAFAAGALDEALAGRGSSLVAELVRFSAAQAEWGVPGSGFPDRYPAMEREGVLAVDGDGAVARLDHTTSALFDVQGRAPVLTLTAALPEGTAGGIALVGRTGDEQTGAVTTVVTDLPTGGAGTVVLPGAERFDRITAVLVNADTSASGADGSWTYARDDQPVEARVTSGPAPAPLGGGTPAGGAPAPSGPPPALPAAAAALDVELLLGRPRLRTVLDRGLAVPVRCSAACAVTATLTLRATDARRLRMRGAIGRATAVLTAAGRRTLRVQLSRAKRRKLRKRRGSLTFVVTVQATDLAGQTQTARRTLVVRR